VDERLIHGQVATIWTNMLNVDRIYVANDKAWQDEMTLNALKMAKPSGVKLTVSSLRRAIENFRNHRFSEERVFLIVKDIPDLETLVDGLDIREANLGNISKHGDSESIKNSVSLTKQEIEMIEAMIAKGVKITAQMVPSEQNVSVEKYFKS
jgi:PTS system mannose-specific IIB component